MWTWRNVEERYWYACCANIFDNAPSTSNNVFKIYTATTHACETGWGHTRGFSPTLRSADWLIECKVKRCSGRENASTRDGRWERWEWWRRNHRKIDAFHERGEIARENTRAVTAISSLSPRLINLYLWTRHCPLASKLQMREVNTYNISAAYTLYTLFRDCYRFHGNFRSFVARNNLTNAPII